MRTRPGCSGSLPATGWSSSSPNWRAKATCSARVMSWSRKNSSRCLRRSARISAARPASREAAPRFTWLSPAPIAQVSGSTLIESGSEPARTKAGDAGVWMVMLLSPRGWAVQRQPSLNARLGGAPLRHPPNAQGGRDLRLGFQQAEDACARHHLLARAGVELGEEVLHVPLD